MGRTIGMQTETGFRIVITETGTHVPIMALNWYESNAGGTR
jgi:hypothetical protein